MEDRKLDDQTLMHCIRLNARLLSGWTSPYLHRMAVGSNYVNEYPLVKQLLDFDV
jgi:predicted ATPase